MTCDRIQDRIASFYIDGQASVAERAEVDIHVKGCEPCRLFLKAVQETHEVLTQAPRLMPSPAVWEAIEERLAPRPAWWEGWFILPRPAYAMAALSVLIIAGSVAGKAAFDTLASARQGSSFQVALVVDSSLEDDIVDNGFGSTAEALL